MLLIPPFGLFLAETIRVLGGSNFHTVLAGRLYRGAQPSADDLQALARDYGIKTVINLRGVGNPAPWYLDECRAAQRLGLTLEDVCLSSGRLPSAQEMRRLVEILERTEYPVYLHCWRGADRTGLVSAMILLLEPDVTLSAARRQLGLRYGHVALGRPAYLDDFFELYVAWLRDQGKEHSPAAFRHWLLDEYQGGWCRCAWERCERTSGPLRLGEPIVYEVRVRNTSPRAWRLSPHPVGGIHVGFRLMEEEREVARGRAGLRAGEIAPGHALETTVVVPPVRQPGRYWLLVDLIDPQHGWFYQTGSEPLAEELDIRE